MPRVRRLDKKGRLTVDLFVRGSSHEAAAANTMATPAPEENNDENTNDKKRATRDEWVRGWDHVVPIDYTHGNFCGPVEKAREMLDSGEVGLNDVDMCLSLTPLMKAARRNHLPLIEFLIERGVDVHMKDNTGETAIIKAKRNEHAEAVALLLKAGAEDLPVPPIKKVFRIPGYSLEPCGTPEQQAEMRRAAEERRAAEDAEEAAAAAAVGA